MYALRTVPLSCWCCFKDLSKYDILSYVRLARQIARHSNFRPNFGNTRNLGDCHHCFAISAVGPVGRGTVLSSAGVAGVSFSFCSLSCSRFLRGTQNVWGWWTWREAKFCRWKPFEGSMETDDSSFSKCQCKGKGAWRVSRTSRGAAVEALPVFGRSLHITSHHSSR